MQLQLGNILSVIVTSQFKSAQCKTFFHMTYSALWYVVEYETVMTLLLCAILKGIWFTPLL